MSDESQWAGLKNSELLSGLSQLVRRGNELTAELLGYLAEVGQRMLYAELGFPSLHAYCVRELRMSEGAAGRRVTAARVCSRFPHAFDLVARGELHLSALCAVGPQLNRQNADDLLTACAGKTRRQVEELLAARFPKPDVQQQVRRLPARELEPLSEARFGVHFTADAELKELLERARDLARYRLPSGDLAALITLALAAFVQAEEKRRFGTGARAHLVTKATPPGGVVRALATPPDGVMAAMGSVSGGVIASKSTPPGGVRAAQPSPPGGVRAANASPTGPVRATKSIPSGPVRATKPSPSGGVRAANASPAGPVRATKPSQSGPVRATKSTPSGPVRATKPSQSGPVTAANGTPPGGVRAAKASSQLTGLRSERSRHIALAARREVYARDRGQCTFISNEGTRCEARGWLEFDHVRPWASRGGSEAGNLRLRCRAHNLLHARQCFGAMHVAARMARAAGGSMKTRTQVQVPPLDPAVSPPGPAKRTARFGARWGGGKCVRLGFDKADARTAK
jgi:hypothetical protein